MLESHPDVMDGEVCIAGTRIPVTAIWDFAAAGYDASQIRKEYPTLTREAIQAAMRMVSWKGDVENPNKQTEQE